MEQCEGSFETDAPAEFVIWPTFVAQIANLNRLSFLGHHVSLLLNNISVAQNLLNWFKNPPCASVNFNT
jgi:hypothetical protein